MEINYLNKNKCKFESSQKDESRAQSADSSNTCSKPRALKIMKLNKFILTFPHNINRLLL